MRKVQVPLGERSYTIMIGPGLLDRLGLECARLKMGASCVIISDAHVAPLYGSKTIQSLTDAGFACQSITVPAGETAKHLGTVQRCYDTLASMRIERKSFIVALGGGVVGDMAGFVAATYLRGIPFVQVPTTLLAQVDSSVGGKVGVNLKAGKNLVGAFHQPRLVLCDLQTLKTLPERQFRAGMAEVIKYGMIHDAAFFKKLETAMPRLMRQDPGVLSEVIARCCQIKAEVVGQDETESGLRAILNFGHTVGHAIEKTAGYGKYLHGEAVAIGMMAAACLSHQLTGLEDDACGRLKRLLEAAGLPVAIRLTHAQKSKILTAMQSDKKVIGGDVKFVLARRVGDVLYGQKVPGNMMSGALDFNP